MSKDLPNPKFPSRRGFMVRGLLALVAGLSARRATAEASNVPQAERGVQRTGEPLTTHIRTGNPPVQPLDTMVLFERGDNNNGRAMTHEVLSLIHQEKGKNSYPWTLYASLETHHEVGDACVVCSRLHKRGSGWSSGLHSEVFNHTAGTALGANIEIANHHAGPEPTDVIGLNIQAVGGPGTMQCGIQIHDKNPETHFEKAVHLKGKGQVGIDLAGKFELGIDAHDNAIRVNEGTPIILDGAGRIRLRYLEGRIEFLNGDRCFASLDVDGEERKL